MSDVKTIIEENKPKEYKENLPSIMCKGPISDPSSKFEDPNRFDFEEGIDTKTREIQVKVLDLLQVIQSNMCKLTSRGDNLSELEGKTQELSNYTEKFLGDATATQKTLWRKKKKALLKVTFIMIALVALLGVFALLHLIDD